MAWLMAGMDAVEPERLTRDALRNLTGPLTLLAIGKAAAAMCRGAASAVDDVDGLCVTSHPGKVPDAVELIIGDHPYPKQASLAAGQRALEISSKADIALISGGGSSLCEVPADGLTLEFIGRVYRRLLSAGLDIAEVNLDRAHLSQIKGGGLGPIPTLLLSDVAGAGPEMVSSGPTIGIEPNPEKVISLMVRAGLSVSNDIAQVVRNYGSRGQRQAVVSLLADGRSAADAIAAHVDIGIGVSVQEGWIQGDLETSLDDFISSTPKGVTIAAGEPSILVEHPAGRGGRNTHAALLAAQVIKGTETVFAAFASDGVDGLSNSAGAIVHGSTLREGGDPTEVLSEFDSASYLDRCDALIPMRPSGTNVGDIWLIWKPEPVASDVAPFRFR